MKVLIFGLSGQVGLALLPSLLACDVQITALSRQLQPASEDVAWLLGSLQAMPDVPADIDAVLSLGPLDAFAAWFSNSSLCNVRVIALGSTGIYSKARSADAHERELAERLAQAEALLMATAVKRHAALTILRPTLVYGQGHDRNLSLLVAYAQRWRFLPLPLGVGGLRQPVHVEDVAQAVLACLNQPASYGRNFDLPGGEVLTMEAMVRRVLARYAPHTLVFRFPAGVLHLAMKVLPVRWRGATGFFARWHQDQVFDASQAMCDFGYHSRPFTP